MMSRINIQGPYKVRPPHSVLIADVSKEMFPVVHSNNIGVGNAIAWVATELSAQAVADGLNLLCAIRNQRG